MSVTFEKIDPAPGFDEYLPHDLLHYVAEAEWGLDGGRSEQRASVLVYAWAAHRRHGRLPEYWRGRLAELQLDERQLERVLATLDELAERWHRLAVGESITLEWSRPERASAAARGKPANRPASAGAEARPRARSAARNRQASAPDGRAPRS
jgi:hypothetical protein